MFIPLLICCQKSDKKDNNGNPKDNTPTAYDGYQLVWQEEFSGNTLDNKKWNIETGTGIGGNWGTGQLDRATDRPENLSIQSGITDADGGALAITTRKEAFMDRNYTSGRINTQNLGAFGPGTRIEARVWARDVKYKGQGFAFWMMPAEKPAGQPNIMWPQGGEIDIMEYVGSIPYHNLGTVHYAWFWKDNQYFDWNHGHQGAYYSYADRQVPAIKPEYGAWPPKDNDPTTGSGGFHTYRIDWYKDRLEFSIDGQVYHMHYFNDGDAFGKAPDGQDGQIERTINGKRVLATEYSHHFNEWKPFEHSFYIILSAGVGGNDNQTYGGRITDDAKFPCSVFVDWVRVYKRL